ncbi:MAG: hypothetical protein V4506_14010 [Bacteroidota bacterium]
MKHSFLYDLDAAYLVIILFITMFAIVIGGYKIGLKKVNPDTDTSTLLSSLLALLGLLLAFTFGMSGSRYDERRGYMIDESNCIGTAILRADLYPDAIANAFKADFKKYLATRIDFFEAGRNEERIQTSLKENAIITNALWKHASGHSFSDSNRMASMLMIPALNEMFDSTSTVNEAFNVTVPDSIVLLLLIFSAISSFFIGYNCGIKRMFDKLLVIGFCMLTCVVIYIILDLDRPRRGMINSGTQVHLLKEIKNSI